MKPGEPQDDALSELEELEKLDAGETHKGIFYAALLYSTYRLWLLAHWAEDEQHFDGMPPPPTLPPPTLRLEDAMPDYDDETKKLMAANRAHECSQFDLNLSNDFSKRFTLQITALLFHSTSASQGKQMGKRATKPTSPMG
uniref:Uncharacterized protein n=1 Tax=Ascaris lumbricoides TaxID=6252 RepID=A0A0M3IX75_ASCLU